MAKRLVTLSRPEHIGDIAFSESNEATLATRGGVLPNERPLFGLDLLVEGRIAVGVADATSEYADSPYNVIREVRVSGFHRLRGQQEEFYRLRSAEIRQLGLIYGSRAPRSTGAMAVAQGNKDFRFFLPIRFVPEKLPLVQQAAFVLDAWNYDNLMLRIFWGNGDSVYDAAPTTTFVYTGFGVGTGLPRCRVSAIYASFGSEAAQASVIPARVWRFFSENIGTDLTGGGSNLRLFSLNRGHTIRSLLVKAGVKSAIAGAENAYASLSETILSQIEVHRGTNNPIRSFVDFISLAEYGASAYAITPTTGYGLIDFSERGDFRSALRTQGLVAGPSGDVDLALFAGVVGAANQGALVVTQEIRGTPVGFD